MATATHGGEVKRDVYSVWGLPPEELTPRLKKLMEGLRSEFGGPEFEPHVTVVGAVTLTESEARDLFSKACEGLKSYTATVDKVATGTFFYQCIFLLLHPTPEVVEASAHCCSHFGYKNSTPYMPHLSLLYGELTDEEKKTALEKACALDESIGSLSFEISRLALYKTDTQDKTCKSWEKMPYTSYKNHGSIKLLERYSAKQLMAIWYQSLQTASKYLLSHDQLETGTYSCNVKVHDVVFLKKLGLKEQVSSSYYKDHEASSFICFQSVADCWSGNAADT